MTDPTLPMDPVEIGVKLRPVPIDPEFDKVAEDVKPPDLPKGQLPLINPLCPVCGQEIFAYDYVVDVSARPMLSETSPGFFTPDVDNLETVVRASTWYAKPCGHVVPASALYWTRPEVLADIPVDTGPVDPGTPVELPVDPIGEAGSK